MKKIICLLTAIIIMVTLCGCGGKKNDLIGDWALVSSGGGRFGYMLRFEKNGTMLCTPGLGSNAVIKSLDDEFVRMQNYYQIAYRIKNDKVIELTVTVFDEKLKLTIEYTLDEDTLIFDDETYKRIS